MNNINGMADYSFMKLTDKMEGIGFFFLNAIEDWNKTEREKVIPKPTNSFLVFVLI
jgi:hypothetical protein